jgi:hypothetical protein
MSGSGVTRREALLAAGTVGAVGAGAVGTAGVIGLFSGDGEPEDPRLLAPRVGGPVPLDDPEASAWNAAEDATVPLLAQQLVPPSLPSLGVADLHVRALHDGARLAFRLSWEDATVEDLDSISQFHDAVAVMLPTTLGGKPPAITMGARGTPVHILQWRATWQRDVDSQGKTGVDQIFPRVVHDVMPDDVLPEETAALYWVGRMAGNPLSQKTRTTPVEQVVAEGYGSTTHLPLETARGRGVHDGKRWTVALGLPMTRSGVGAPFTPGASTSIAFAVWLGDQANRGGRKHYADWIPFSLGGA